MKHLPIRKTKKQGKKQTERTSLRLSKVSLDINFICKNDYSIAIHTW
jgi:hypothetical protein